MKTKFLIILSLLFLGFSNTSCENEIVKTQAQEGTNPVLSASPINSSNIVLLQDDAENTALQLNWTSPSYFEESVEGSLVGEFTLEIAKTNDFTDSYKVILGHELTYKFLVSELNIILLDLGYLPEESGDVYIRVQSLFLNTDTLFSETLVYQITPFSTIIPPLIEVPSQLYIVGDAPPGGWVGGDLPDSRKFTLESPTVYSITIDLTANKEYHLITDVTQANWTPVFRLAPDANRDDFVYGGSFVWDGDGSEFEWASIAIKSPPNDATYILTFNFQTATFTVAEQ